VSVCFRSRQLPYVMLRLPWSLPCCRSRSRSTPRPWASGCRTGRGWRRCCWRWAGLA
jgi:hypothetical protein